jgi:lysophospholipase L1-like esterase
MKRTLMVGAILAAILAASVCGPATRSRAVVILCAGDSLTAEAYPRMLRQALREEGVRARVLDEGRSGNTSGEYLKFLRGASLRLKAEAPDAILLQLGTNDVRFDGDRTALPDFVRNMREIVRIFGEFRDRAGRPSTLFLATIPPVPESSPFPFTPASARRVVEEINPALRDLAAGAGLTLVDNYALFAEAPELLPGVHPSEEGYRRLALNWLRALRPLLD